jgi:hypothetical protein
MQNYHIPEAGPYDFHHLRDGTEDMLIITARDDRAEDGPHGIASFSFWNDFKPEENGPREATARLLAAAPELRDMLARLCNAYERMSMYGEPIDFGHCVVDAKLLLARVNATSEQCGFVLPTHFRHAKFDADSTDAADDESTITL